MNEKPSCYCGRCRQVHAGPCPSRPAHGFSKRPGKAGRGGRPWGRKRQRVFERDRYFCQNCLRNGKDTWVELHGRKHGICDHIVPLSEGGSDDDSNLETQCQACDKVKRALESARARRGGGGKS